MSIFPYRVKKDFAGVIKLRILAGEMILDYLGGPSVIRRVLQIGKREAEEPMSEQFSGRKTGLAIDGK